MSGRAPYKTPYGVEKPLLFVLVAHAFAILSVLYPSQDYWSAFEIGAAGYILAVIACWNDSEMKFGIIPFLILLIPTAALLLMAFYGTPQNPPERLEAPFVLHIVVAFVGSLLCFNADLKIFGSFEEETTNHS